MSDYTSPEDEKFFSAIGRLTITWGHIEFGLDALVTLLHVKLGGRETIERVMPWSLKRKVDYIKRYFRKHYPNEWGTDAMCAIMDDIIAASEARHDIVHGVVIEHADGAGEATLIRLMRDTDVPFQEKQIHVTTAIVLQHAVDANEIGMRLFEAAAGLRAALRENVPDKPSGEG